MFHLVVQQSVRDFVFFENLIEFQCSFIFLLRFRPSLQTHQVHFTLKRRGRSKCASLMLVLSIKLTQCQKKIKV